MDSPRRQHHRMQPLPPPVRRSHSTYQRPWSSAVSRATRRTASSSRRSTSLPGPFAPAISDFAREIISEVLSPWSATSRWMQLCQTRTSGSSSSASAWRRLTNSRQTGRRLFSQASSGSAGRRLLPRWRRPVLSRMHTALSRVFPGFTLSLDVRAAKVLDLSSNTVLAKVEYGCTASTFNVQKIEQLGANMATIQDHLETLKAERRFL